MFVSNAEKLVSRGSHPQEAVERMIFELEKAISVFHQTQNVNTAYVCGSYANGTATERSDLDFAILPVAKMSLMEEMRLQSALSEALSFEDIDLVNLLNAPTRLQFNLVSTGRLIYEKDTDFTDDYTELLLKHYYEKKHRYRSYQTDLETGLKEDYG